MARKNALGRGLGALIDDAGDLNAPRSTASIHEIDITDIEANPWQPRTRFDEERLNELAISIKEFGIIQPLTLRKLSKDRYQIIAGERRFRASKIAGLDKVPAYVRTAEDDTMLEMALVENIQREDLDPVEIAISYQRLIDECDLTQESMSDRVGKKRSTVANYLRLLKLPAEIQLGLREKQISMGHARALVNIEDVTTQIKLFEQIIKNDLSVRKIEQAVRNLNDKKLDAPKVNTNNSLSEEYEALKKQLSTFFKTNIQFNRSDDGKGKIVIPFRSDEDLEKIIDILDKTKSLIRGSENIVLREKVNNTPFFLCVTIIWLLAANTSFSQQDTLVITAVDTIMPTTNIEVEKIYSPHKATFYSAVLPGLGQAYNKKYWKIPILYAGIGALGYAIHFNTTYYKKYKAAYRDFIIQDPNNKSYLEFIPPTWTEEDLQNPQNANWFESALDNKKTYYQRYRDLSYIGMVLVYVINLVDASVDAHFANFDISDDLSLRVTPVLVDPYPAPYSGPGINLTLKF